MELLSAIRRNLLFHPLRGVVIDDQRTWRGIDLMVVSWHIARAIERTSDSSRVGIMLPTSGAFPAACIAAWTLGRTIVPLNYLLSRSDLEYVAKDAGLDALVTVGPMLDLIGGSLPGLTDIRLDQMKFTGIPPVRMTNPLKRDDIAVVLYTSGTSGRPKGVMLSGGNIGANVRQIKECVDFSSKDTILGVLPKKVPANETQPPSPVAVSSMSSAKSGETDSLDSLTLSPRCWANPGTLTILTSAPPACRRKPSNTARETGLVFKSLILPWKLTFKALQRLAAICAKNTPIRCPSSA